MSYKKVIAIGDSFTRGDELADCSPHPYDNSCESLNTIYYEKTIFSQHTWPALIAKSLSIDYDCIAVGGIGNQLISWIAGSQIKSRQDCFFIINWSWFARFDLVDIKSDDWLTTHPRHNNTIDHYFYRYIDNDLWNLYRNLQQMHSTIQLLKKNNVNFIMTCLDDDRNKKVNNLRQANTPLYDMWSKSVDLLQDEVCSYIFDFDNMSFLEWSRHNGFALGPNGHPLEDAHIAAAKYMQQRITL